MISLIIHDDPELLKISSVILEKFGKVKTCTSLSEARNLIHKESFKFVILDLQLPEFDGGIPKPDGGFNFLLELEKSDWAKQPQHLITITNFSDALEKYKALIQDRSYSFVNTQNAEWTNELESKIKMLIRREQKQTQTTHHGEFDVCIISALEKEIVPFKTAFNLETMEIPGDPLIYYRGHFVNNSGEKKTILTASLNKMGLPHTAVLATRIIHTFLPKTIIISGICGGASDDANIGDIIISSKIYDYSQGKLKEEVGKITHEFSTNSFDLSIPWHQKMSVLTSDQSELATLHSTLSKDELEINPAPKILLGPTASGPFVVAAKEIVNRILKLDRKILGIDMESYSVLLAKEFFSLIDSPNVFAIKGVSDRADVAKDDRYHAYCCNVTARFIIDLLKRNFFQK